MAIIKTDPSRRELSESRARNSFKKLSYTWKLSLEYLEKLSLDYTLATSNFINPLTLVIYSFTSNNSGNSSDYNSKLSSDNRALIKAKDNNKHYTN